MLFLSFFFYNDQLNGVTNEDVGLEKSRRKMVMQMF